MEPKQPSTRDALQDSFLKIFQSPQQMKDWILTFLDIDFPSTHVDPDSNSSPLEAMYQAYSTYRDDLCMKIPGFIWLSSRDSYKTLSGSILNIILMIHFKAQISHLAAVKKQAEKSLYYCNLAIRKLRPYIEKAGRKVVTESKSKVQVLNEDQTMSYIDVVVANLAGGNSEHCPVATYDEIDTLSPQGLVGYKEAQLIPTRYLDKWGPLTIKFSTRKFAFGIFEKEIQNHEETGEKLLRWNIIDVTEKCKPSRHKPELPKEVRYISKSLPLRNLSLKQYEELDETKKAEFYAIEAFGGCATCPLLPVCRTRLATRPDHEPGGLYKNIDFTIREFKILNQDPDMAEAQLMCWKPTKMGLVYGRFDITPGKGNVLTLKEAYEKYNGPMPKGTTLKELVMLMRSNGIKFYAGVDWGFRHGFAITISAKVADEWWFFDSYCQPGLEYEDMIKLAETVRDMYKPVKWYADTAQPMFIKGFQRRRMPCQKFDKDIQGGIECVRGQIVDASGRRRLRVIKHDRTEWLIKGFQMHHFKLDAAGVPTTEPDDEEYADTMDSVRYKGQCLFDKKSAGMISPKPSPMEMAVQAQQKPQTDSQRIYQDWMSQKVHQLATHDKSLSHIKSASGGFFADFGEPEDT